MKEVMGKENKRILLWTAFELFVVVVLGGVLTVTFGAVVMPFFLIVGIVIFAAFVVKLHEVFGSRMWLPAVIMSGMLLSLVTYVIQHG